MPPSLKRSDKGPGILQLLPSGYVLRNDCVTELKLSTLHRVALAVAKLKQKHTYCEKNIQPISMKTSWPWCRQTSDCC